MICFKFLFEKFAIYFNINVYFLSNSSNISWYYHGIFLNICFQNNNLSLFQCNISLKNNFWCISRTSPLIYHHFLEMLNTFINIMEVLFRFYWWILVEMIRLSLLCKYSFYTLLVSWPFRYSLYLFKQYSVSSFYLCILLLFF